MNWKREPPTKPGLYWTRRDGPAELMASPEFAVEPARLTRVGPKNLRVELLGSVSFDTAATWTERGLLWGDRIEPGRVAVGADTLRRWIADFELGVARMTQQQRMLAETSLHQMRLLLPREDE